ncbi:hypothetical protein MTR67_026170 [Solanum verrucosum]|uniref:Uncharacterized protein n=1 Tax=Solanum verrucosum TaxID=315347 RepID=A0AAF0TZ36_SOLVR|nr:hypothetical protein MTR67_026170 [Solanum verrucosum]
MGLLGVSKASSLSFNGVELPWMLSGRGIMEDDLGFTVVNFSRLANSGNRDRHDPFIFAEQVQQENSMQLKSSMNSDSTDLAILENSHVPYYENNDWDMINEKMSNSEGSIDQPPHRVAWKGDVYSQFHDADSGHGQIAQTRGIPIVAENTPTSHENTGDPKNIALRKTTTHAEFATSGPGDTGAQSEILENQIMTSDLSLLFNVKTLPIHCLDALLNGYKVKVSNIGSLTLFPGLTLYNVFFHLEDLLGPLINLLPPATYL